MRSVVIHGHFYQPPRDDPWTGTIPSEASAAPFHDWNERIEQESYAPVSRSLESLSFDFGPTLLPWLEREAPETYAAVLAADRASVAQHAGHGNALAMPYHHVILPLSPRRDKVTEVRWGIADFRRRFERTPEGMWLPETAVDDETLDVLAAEGIRFTILAPHQVERLPAAGLPGWYRTASGRRIALCIYDGPLSHDVAFGPLVQDAGAWADRLLSDSRALVAIATDGETFGHHHREGAVTLARVLDTLGRRTDVRVENFAAFLARQAPADEVRLVAPSSWSCPHGVERWRAECGCRAAPERGLHQRWRAPLRAALEWLAGELHAVFEREGRAVFGDPWAARDAYGDTLGTPGHRLLEMERHTLGMFTSCGWFFDDIAGLESVIVLRYAARAIELAGAAGPRLEAGLLERLALAPSNDPAVGTGRELYLERVKARIPRATPA
jgi:alpha-amylase/alpha-mannosidase (GH57 family)